MLFFHFFPQFSAKKERKKRKKHILEGGRAAEEYLNLHLKTLTLTPHTAASRAVKDQHKRSDQRPLSTGNWRRKKTKQHRTLKS